MARLSAAALLPPRAVVLGHSGGGVVASQLAERHPDRVQALVYLAGMMLPDGMEFAELVAATDAPGKSGIVPHLRWSDDGGHTWSHYRARDAGQTGQTAKRVKWNQLGSTRRNSGLDRIFEISSTDVMQVCLIGAELEV